MSIGFIRNKFYIDEFYEWLIQVTQESLARLAEFLDRWIVDGAAVRGLSGATFGFGSLLRMFQIGNLQAYAFLLGLGVVALIYFVIFH